MRKHVLTAALALCASIPDAFATTAATSPVGFQTAETTHSLSALGTNLVNRALITGLVRANTGDAVALAAPFINAGTVLSPDVPAYIEVMDGPLVGERFDVDVPATIAAAGTTIIVQTATPNNNTLASLPGDVLAGVRIELRNHITIGQVQAMFTPALTGSDSLSDADQLFLFRDGSFEVFYLRGDGAEWRNAVTDDRNCQNEPIAPGVGFFLKRSHDGPVTMTQLGAVRTTPAFRQNLTAGLELVSLGFPGEMSPAELNATPAPYGTWTGSATPAQADQLMVFDEATAGFRIYYLQPDGSWCSVTQDGTDYRNAPVLAAGRAFFIKRGAADSLNDYSRPFGL